MGNRLTKSDSSTGNESYLCDAANRLKSRTVGYSTLYVTSDANGNTQVDTTSGGDKRYSLWDSQNRLAACTVFASSDGTSTTSAFTYGSDGLRRRGAVTESDGTKTRTIISTAGPYRSYRPILYWIKGVSTYDG